MILTNPGFGVLTLDTSRASENIRFFPGHYMSLKKGVASNAVDSWATIIGTELQACPTLRGVQIREYWTYLEPTKNNYYFDDIVAKLSGLRLSATDIRKLCILIATRTFEDRHAVPDYMLTDPIYEGGELLNTTDPVDGAFVMWQNPYVVERFIALVQALSNALNPDGLALKYDSQLAMISLPETATGEFVSVFVPPVVFDATKHYNGLATVQTALVQAFPQTLVRQMTNVPRTSLDQIFAGMDAAGITGVGGPNTLPNDPGLNTASGDIGLYPRLRLLKDDYVIAMEVQNPDYYYTKFSPYTGGSYPTVQEIMDFNKSSLNWDAHMIIWTRSTATGNSGTAFADYVNVQNLLNEAAQTADVFGGLRHARPMRIS